MNTTIQNVRIKSIATCLPQYSVNVYDNAELYKDNRKKLEKIVTTSGFHIRHILPKNSKLTASDLCYYAAEKVLENMDRSDIAAVVFITGTPDYILSSSSSFFQKRLNLSEDILAIDMTQGCAGMVSGLLMASKLVDKDNKKVLLLVGNTLSKIYGTGEDAKIDPPFHGDGGSAILLEYSEDAEPMFFDAGTISDNEVLHHPNGAFKNPPTKDMFKEDGSFDYGSYMDGLGVFQFSISKVPQSISSVLKYSNKTIEDVDYFILHQANIAIIKNIARMLDIPIDKVPYSTLPKYGNLSVDSIPSVISDLYDIFNKKKYTILLSGFGIGLSWVSCVLTFDNVICYPTIFIEA